MRELGDADWEALDPLGDVMRRGLALQRRVHCQHDLVDTARLDPADERIDRQILGPHAFERGKPAAQHMKAAGKEPRAIERPEIGYLFDHAQGTGIAARVSAYTARVCR